MRRTLRLLLAGQVPDRDHLKGSCLGIATPGPDSSTGLFGIIQPGEATVGMALRSNSTEMPAPRNCATIASSSGRGNSPSKLYCHCQSTPKKTVEPFRAPPVDSSSKNIRQRPTLPRGFPRSTIGSGGLNFRVRDGNGCDPSDIATGNSSSIAALIQRAMRAYEGKIDF